LPEQNKSELFSKIPYPKSKGKKKENQGVKLWTWNMNVACLNALAGREFGFLNYYNLANLFQFNAFSQLADT
jgi:hypothetical protein